MHNDKSFAAYALILLAAVASVLTATVLAGITRVPPPLVFLEHVAMGLLIRAAYKSTGGWNWADWSVGNERAGAAIAATGYPSISGSTANAEG